MLHGQRSRWRCLQLVCGLFSLARRARAPCIAQILHMILHACDVNTVVNLSLRHVIHDVIDPPWVGAGARARCSHPATAAASARMMIQASNAARCAWRHRFEQGRRRCMIGSSVASPKPARVGGVGAAAARGASPIMTAQPGELVLQGTMRHAWTAEAI